MHTITLHGGPMDGHDHELRDLFYMDIEHAEILATHAPPLPRVARLVVGS